MSLLSNLSMPFTIIYGWHLCQPLQLLQAKILNCVKINSNDGNRQMPLVSYQFSYCSETSSLAWSLPDMQSIQTESSSTDLEPSYQKHAVYLHGSSSELFSQWTHPSQSVQILVLPSGPKVHVRGKSNLIYKCSIKSRRAMYLTNSLRLEV